MKKSLLLLLFILSFYSNAIAQYNTWEALPDTGIDHLGAGRYEDIYFFDTLTGFAACYYNRIYKTTDGGKHWQVKSDISDYANFRSIEFSDNMKYGIAGALNGKLFRSTDSGNTWTNISSSVTDTISANPKSMCGLSHFGNIFYGVGWWGSKTARFYKSIDSGITWTTSYLDTNMVSGLVDVQFTSKDTGFITGGVNATLGFGAESVRSVILKTTNGGITWKTVFSDTVIGGRIWKIQVLKRNFMVASIEPYYKTHVYMLKSNDAGETWRIINVDTITAVSGIGTQGIGFIDTQYGTMGGWYDGMYQTNDGGATWTWMVKSKNLDRFFRVDENHLFVGGDSIYLYKTKPYERKYPGTTDKHNKISFQEPHVSTASPLFIHKLYPVSPNPTTGKIKIEFDLGGSTNVVIEIASIDSRHVYRIENKMLQKGHYTYYWDGSDLPAGNYFVWLGNDQIPVTQKFVISR